jgi:PKD repeat protein
MLAREGKMGRKSTFFCGLMILMTIISVGCDVIPSNFNFGINADIDTTSEIGDNTLERIDAINETIANGFEVGPETRDLIDELNETLANGVKAGFDDETLARVDELLRVIEDGFKIGLDDDTLNSIDGMVDTIDQMPGNWEATGLNIIQTLKNSAGTTAGRLADEVSRLMSEARINYQQMTAITGIEFRCNVDFLGSKVGSTAQEFIGKSIVGKLKNLLSGEPETQAIPTPWVCQVIPESVELSKIGDQLIFVDGIITLTGYNYVDANSPTAMIVDESGTPVPGIPLYPYRASPYQIQLNMQELDFSQVPARSRIVFKWPNISESSGIAILMPGHTGPVANYSVDKLSGNAPLTVNFTDTSSGNPTEWEWVFGDGATSLERNPSHTFLEKRDFLVQLTVKNSQGESSVTKTISVGAELSADFRFSPDGGGDTPLLITFKDESKGNPTSWLWDFGDGTPASTEQDPQHLYMTANPDGYLVTLTVSDGVATSTKSATNRIRVMEKLEADFTSDKVSGRKPLEVTFTDNSSGGSSIVGYSWDFGDGSPVSALKSPTHTYTSTGVYDVTLTVFRADGSKDTEKKIEYINVLSLTSMFSRELFVSQKDVVYFATFLPGRGGTQYDTKIPVSKYICGVNGFGAYQGVIMPILTAADPLRVYMFEKNNTWWILADFEDVGNYSGYYQSEDWLVNVICFDKSLEGDTLLYRDDFRGITGGKPFKTGIKTSDYFNCGVVGIGGRAYTGYLYGTMFEVVAQAYMDGSGDQWVIHTDMPVYQDGDVWDIKVMCLKRSDQNNVEKPPYIAKTISFQSSVTTQMSTGISAADYYCGVNGYNAEFGDLYTIDPNNLVDARNIAPTVMVVRTIEKNGAWWVEADIANRFKKEDWTVNVLCVRKTIAVKGTPSP